MNISKAILLLISAFFSVTKLLGHTHLPGFQMIFHFGQLQINQMQSATKSHEVTRELECFVMSLTKCIKALLGKVGWLLRAQCISPFDAKKRQKKPFDNYLIVLGIKSHCIWKKKEEIAEQVFR